MKPEKVPAFLDSVLVDVGLVSDKIKLSLSQHPR